MSEPCLFEGCPNAAELSRGRPINGFCSGHRKQKRLGRTLALHPTRGRRLSPRALIRELALRYADATDDVEARRADDALWKAIQRLSGRRARE